MSASTPDTDPVAELTAIAVRCRMIAVLRPDLAAELDVLEDFALSIADLAEDRTGKVVYIFPGAGR